MKDNEDEFVTDYITTSVKETFKKHMNQLKQNLTAETPSTEQISSEGSSLFHPNKNADTSKNVFDCKKIFFDSEGDDLLKALPEKVLIHSVPEYIEALNDDDNILKHVSEELLDNTRAIENAECIVVAEKPTCSGYPKRGRKKPKVLEPLPEDVDKALNDDDELLNSVAAEFLDNTRAIDDSDCQVVDEQPRSSNRKRRHIKYSTRQPQAKNSVEEITILDDPSTSVKVDDEFNYETSVKVLWKSVKVERIPVRRLQKLQVVFEHLMRLENVPMERILLTLRGVPVKPNDTPHSLDLKVCDFLDGGIVSDSLVGFSVGKALKKRNEIKIKFQTADKKFITIAGCMHDPMKILMVAYAEQAEKQLNNLIFSFDGCPVDPEETLSALGVENNDVLDVVEK